MNNTAKKTIVIVAPYFPPYGGGLERYAFEIVSRLHKEYGWRVIVITSGERYGNDLKEEINGLIIYRLAYRFKISNTPFSFRWFKKIRGILQKENPDIINIHTPVPGISDITAMLAKNKPVIVTYHAGSMRKNKFMFDILVWFYEYGPMQWLLKRANQIICSSDFVRFNFLKKYVHKSTTITPAVDTDLFKPAPEKKTKYPSILFVAGLAKAEQHKGLQILIEAVASLQKNIPDLHLIVVGDGDMKSKYEERVRKLGLGETVTFTGRLAGEKLAEQYQQAHVFALPTSNDSFSMAILEAMASGLPVVSTKVGGIPDLVSDNETGFLTVLQNLATLEKGLGDLLTNPRQASSFGTAGQIRVINNFNWNPRAGQYNQIFSKLFQKETNISHKQTAATLQRNNNLQLTVVILTYNSESTIKTCMDSLIAQTNKNFNVIIVDDESTDETLKIANSYKIDSQLEIQVTKNGTHNLSVGRNIGLKASATDLVAFLDSDDRAEPHWIDIIIQTFKLNPEAALLSGPLVFSSRSVVGEAIATNDSVVRKIFGKGVLLFCTANSAFNKKVLNNKYFFDEDFVYAEDLEIVSRIQKYHKWIFVPEMLVYYSSRETLKNYAVQMYKYGLWKIYYGFTAKDYRPIDFIPLAIKILSILAAIIFTSWVPLLALLIFSFFESLFVILVTRHGVTTSLLIFPVWLTKNYAWSFGVAIGVVTLITNKELRSRFSKKRRVSTIS